MLAARAARLRARGARRRARASAPAWRSSTRTRARSAPTASSTPSPLTSARRAASSSSTSAPRPRSTASRRRANTWAASSRRASRSAPTRSSPAPRSSRASRSPSRPRSSGRNTLHSMQSGIVYGYVGLVDGLVERICARARLSVRRHRDRRPRALIAPLSKTIAGGRRRPHARRSPHPLRAQQVVMPVVTDSGPLRRRTLCPLPRAAARRSGRGHLRGGDVASCCCCCASICEMARERSMANCFTSRFWRRRELVQERGDLRHVARLEERLEVVVREAHVAAASAPRAARGASRPRRACRPGRRAPTGRGARADRRGARSTRLLREADRLVARRSSSRRRRSPGARCTAPRVFALTGAFASSSTCGDRLLLAVRLLDRRWRGTPRRRPSCRSIWIARSTASRSAFASLLLLAELREVEARERAVLHQVLRALERALGLVELLLRELRDAEREPVFAVAAERDDLREDLLGLLVAPVLHQLLREDAAALQVVRLSFQCFSRPPRRSSRPMAMGRP